MNVLNYIMNVGGGTEAFISPHKRTSVPEARWEAALEGGILQSVFHRADLRVSKPLTESLKDVAECRAPPSRHAGRVHTL